MADPESSKEVGRSVRLASVAVSFVAPEQLRPAAGSTRDLLSLPIEPLQSGEVEFGEYSPAIDHWSRVLGRSVPHPTFTDHRGKQRLAPEFVEWVMGLPEGWVVDTPGLLWYEAVEVLGNGVVPDQAALALREMFDTLGEEILGDA